LSRRRPVRHPIGAGLERRHGGQRERVCPLGGLPGRAPGRPRHPAPGLLHALGGAGIRPGPRCCARGAIRGSPTERATPAPHWSDGAATSAGPGAKARWGSPGRRPAPAAPSFPTNGHRSSATGIGARSPDPGPHRPPQRPCKSRCPTQTRERRLHPRRLSRVWPCTKTGDGLGQARSPSRLVAAQTRHRRGRDHPGDTPSGRALF